jgi:hypothetical protein
MKPREAALALAGGGDRQFLQSFYRFPSVYDDLLRVFRLIQWNPSPASATTPAMPEDSSGVVQLFSFPQLAPAGSRRSDRDARRFNAERDETRHELGDVSKAGITQVELEH